MWRNFRHFPLLCFFCAGSVAAQHSETVNVSAQKAPEEIIITGAKTPTQLRLQIAQAERQAYDLFNQFNDDRRFNISCDTHSRTGSRFVQQVCQPEFMIQAMRGHAQDYYYNMPGATNLPDGSVTQQFQPFAAEIDRHRPAFQEKMRQIAQDHPEFLEAISHYAELQEELRELLSP